MQVSLLHSSVFASAFFLAEDGDEKPSDAPQYAAALGFRLRAALSRSWGLNLHFERDWCG
jgi:hypothetical protein